VLFPFALVGADYGSDDHVANEHCCGTPEQKWPASDLVHQKDGGGYSDEFCGMLVRARLR